MSKFTNTGAGAHGINIEDEQGARTVWLDPGETVEFADDKVIKDKAFHDDIKKGDAAAKKAADDAAAGDSAVS